MADPTEKYKALVNRLVEGTRQGTISWELDIFRGDVFSRLGDYRIIVDSTEDEEGDASITIKVKDAKSRIIDTVSDTNLANEFCLIPGYSNYWQAMSGLYHMARRAAYGADEALDDILKTLGGDDN